MASQYNSGVGDNIGGNKNTFIKSDQNINLPNKDAAETALMVFGLLLVTFLIAFIAPGITLATITRMLIPDLTIGQVWGISLLSSFIVLFSIRYFSETWDQSLTGYTLFAGITFVVIIISGLIMGGNKLSSTMYYLIGFYEPDEYSPKLKKDILEFKSLNYSLSKIRNFKILKKNKIDNKIEYNLSFEIENKYNSKALLTIIYEKTDFFSNWHYDNHVFEFLTYDNVAPINEWHEVTPLENSTYIIESFGKKFWIKDQNSKRKYRGGGEDGENFNMKGKSVFIRSRESEPVSLTFKYFFK